MTFEFDVDFSKCGEYGFVCELEDGEFPRGTLEDRRVLAKLAILEIDGFRYTVRTRNKKIMLNDIEEKLYEYCLHGNNRRGTIPVYLVCRYVIPLKITLKPITKPKNQI